MRNLCRGVASVGVAAVVTLLLCSAANAVGAPQEKATLISGILYKVHARFLEIKSDEKHIAVVKTDAATVYWDGKMDKAASKRDLRAGDELIIETIEKNQVMVAKKVRFLHR